MIWVPPIFRPDFTWPYPVRETISDKTPPAPSIPGPTSCRIWGFVHRLLSRFSEFYCSWFGVQYNAQIIELPFGLLLKWTDRTRIEEAIAMRMARAAGMPVPKVLCCGEHPSVSKRRFSILMTRLPGYEVPNDYIPLDVEIEGPWIEELRRCVTAMRKWKSPFGEGRICSACDTSIRSSRVPEHQMGPFNSESELHDYLLGPASSHGFSSPEAYDKTLEEARRIRDKPHQIVFTHGDFKAHNILVDDQSRLSGFLDWECAGWHPDYWEYTTAMRFGRGSWWYQVALELGGQEYMEDLKCDIALNRLTVDSYIAF